MNKNFRLKSVIWGLGVVGLLAYSIVFAEFFLRVLKPQPLMPRYIQAGDHGIRENIPSIEYQHWTPEVKVSMRINEQGMRSDHSFSLEKPAGTCRVALFGDSFFMGYEASLEHSFAGQLERFLKEQGKTCEILNFAVSGFGTAESLIALKEKALAYQPDFVVLEWHYTDPDDNLRSQLFDLDESGELVQRNSLYLPGVGTREKLMRYSGYRWLIENSHLYSAAREKAGRAIKNLKVTQAKLLGSESVATNASNQESSKPFHVNDYILRDQRPEIHALDSALVLSMAELSQQSKAQLILVDVPFYRFDHKFISSLPLLDEKVIEQVSWVSPLSVFERSLTQGLKLYRTQGQGHLTEDGYRQLAQIVFDKMIELEPLPQSVNYQLTDTDAAE